MLPWAVFPLGLRPAFDRNHGCCTLRRIILLLLLRPVPAYNIGCWTFRWIIFLFGLRPLLLVLWLLHIALGCVLLGLRPVFDRNHIWRNTHNFLWSLGVLSDTTEFHALSRHSVSVRAIPLLRWKIFVRCVVTGCEVKTRIFFNNERSERNENTVQVFFTSNKSARELANHWQQRRKDVNKD